MSNQIDPLHEHKAECERLRQQAAAQEQRISELTHENERLQQEAKEIKAERDLYSKLYGDKLRKEYEANAEQIEAEILDGMKSGVDFAAFVRELEAEMEGKAEKRDAG